jgi:hypothetical protein
MTTAVVKQYGAERTGTNVVRALMRQAFPAAEVLMHVLGDKHGPPSSLVLDRAWRSGLPALEVVTAATLEVPARTTDLSDRAQRRELARLAPVVEAAVRAGGLRVVVSIKDPHAWLVSMVSFHSLQPLDRHRAYGAAAESRLRSLCHDFDERYRRWLALLQRLDSRALLVRLEDLLRDERPVVSNLGRCVGSAPRTEASLPAEVAWPAHWDHLPERMLPVPFDIGYYRERAYLDELGPHGRRLIRNALNWTLMERCGYVPARY